MMIADPERTPRKLCITSQVLVRLCDHIVVWAAQGLVRAAAAGHPPLDQGQQLRLAACRETLAEALRTCSVKREGGGDGEAGVSGGAGGGMYERRLAFLDDLLELLRVPSDQMEGGGWLGMVMLLRCCLCGLAYVKTALRLSIRYFLPFAVIPFKA